MSIRYGPFPRVWKPAIGFSTVMLGILAFACFIGSTETLRCEGDGECVVTTRYVLFAGGAERFAAATLRLVRYEPSPSWRGGGALALHTGSRWLTVLASQSDDAYLAFPEVRDFIEGKTSRLEVGSHVPVVLRVIIVGLLAAIGAALLDAMSRPGVITLIVDRQRLTVRGHWLGVPLRERHLSLARVAAVKAELGSATPSFSTGEPLPAGRVVLIVANDECHPLTSTMLFGTDIHERAARELAAALAVPVLVVAS